MKMLKMIKPLIIPVAALLGYAVIKGKKSSSVVSDIAQNTSRGLKAVIVGNVLEYWFKSRSDKQTATATTELDSAGEPIITFNPPYGTANSLHLFIENLKNVMKKDN